MSISIRDNAVAAGGGMKRRRHAVGEYGRVVTVASFILLPALGGCSFGSTDTASQPRQTAANFFGSPSRSVPAVAMPPSSNSSVQMAAAPGGPPQVVSPVYPASASVPAGAPPTYAAGAVVPSGAPSAGIAAAPLETSPQPQQSQSQQPPPAENPLSALYNALKDGGEQCAMPTEPCDNIHRVQN